MSIFVNFTSPTVANGATLYKMATKPLSTQFDGSRANHSIFQSQIRDKVVECGWDHLISFLIDGEVVNLIDNPDLIPWDIIKDAKETRDDIVLNGPREAARNVTQITQAQVDEALRRCSQAHPLSLCQSQRAIPCN